MSDFKKMDDFIKAHRPTARLKLPPPKAPEQGWRGPLVLAGALAAMIVVAINLRTMSDAPQVSSLAEAMEWEVTADDLPAEAEDLMAMVD